VLLTLLGENAAHHKPENPTGKGLEYKESIRYSIDLIDVILHEMTFDSSPQKPNKRTHIEIIQKCT
jgi:hypothetical protein